MLLVAAGARLQPWDARPGDVRLEVGGCRVVAAVGGCLGQCAQEPGRLVLTEGLVRHDAAARDSAPLARVVADARLGTLEIQSLLRGGRPLYYHLSGDGEFVCSTHASGLRQAGVELVEDTQALPEFFVYRCVMPPRTLFRDVRQVGAGSTLHVRLAGGRVESVKESILDLTAATEDVPLAGAADLLVRRLGDGLQSLVEAPERVAVLLSGGIDSSIAFQVCRERFGPRPSYSTSYPFEDPGLDWERYYALTAAYALGATHRHHVSAPARYAEGLIEAIAAAEIPVHHLQSVLLHLLFEEAIPASEDLVVIAVGAGGLFGNFRNFLQRLDDPVFRVLARWPLRPLVRRVSRATGRMRVLSGQLCEATKPRNLDAADNPLWAWHVQGDADWTCGYFGVKREALFQHPLATLLGHAPRTVYDTWALYSLLGDEAVTQNVWSKIGEAGGRSVLYPFYDDDLVRTVASLRWETRMAQPENRIRKAMGERVGVPRFILERVKTGFGVKRRDWASAGGVLDPLIRLAAPAFDEREMRRMQSTDPVRAMTLWNMINYALWKRLVLGREDAGALVAELSEG